MSLIVLNWGLRRILLSVMAEVNIAGCGRKGRMADINLSPSRDNKHIKTTRGGLPREDQIDRVPKRQIDAYNSQSSGLIYDVIASRSFLV